MRRPPLGWIATVTLTALLSLSTLGLYHVYAHAGDGHSEQCATCRVVGSSKALVSTAPQAAGPFIVEAPTADHAGDVAIQQFIARPGSRGPPSVS
jgi:hypothetical protein